MMKLIRYVQYASNMSTFSKFYLNLPSDSYIEFVWEYPKHKGFIIFYVIRTHTLIERLLK